MGCIEFGAQRCVILKLGHSTHQKYIESFKIECWRRTLKISWDWSCEKRGGITQNQGGKEHPTYNRKTEG